MSNPLLSILIPTVVGREDEFNLLFAKITYQYQGDEVEVAYLKDNKEMTIGEKREKLYQMANGLFSWQVDDDDEIANNAIELILEAIKSNPEVDVISFEEYCWMDGKEYCSNHRLDYPDWEGDGSKLLSDGFHFHRTPFMKSVVKTEIARSVPIPHIRFGEDHQWSQALKPHLKTEIHIPRQLYRYIHQSSDFNTRYGFDKS